MFREIGEERAFDGILKQIIENITFSQLIKEDVVQVKESIHLLDGMNIMI